MLLGALCAHPRAASAQQEAPESELWELKRAVEYARFEDVEARAGALLTRTDVSARQRNDALELLAIAQIARRDEAGAHATLSELFARDPEHPERLRDPGPSVEAMFARTRAEPRAPLAVTLTSMAVMNDAQGRALLQVSLGEGRDAIDSVHVFARFPSQAEPSHVVAEVGVRELLAIALPLPLASTTPAPAVQTLELYLEARAPSGAVIGQDGSPEAPLRVRLRQAPECTIAPARSLLRGPWWLWTSIAIVIAGVSVSGALAAH